MYLVLIINQEQHFGIVLIHNRQKQSLENWTFQNRRSYLAFLPKDGVKDVQKTHFGFLKNRVDFASNLKKKKKKKGVFLTSTCWC